MDLGFSQQARVAYVAALEEACRLLGQIERPGTALALVGLPRRHFLLREFALPSMDPSRITCTNESIHHVSRLSDQLGELRRRARNEDIFVFRRDVSRKGHDPRYTWTLIASDDLKPRLVCGKPIEYVYQLC